MTQQAWTLGYREAYEKAVRIPGNGKAPGGYLFRTKKEAKTYAANHPEAARYAPYKVALPRPYEKCSTRDYLFAALARHYWHTHGDEGSPGTTFMAECGVCLPQPIEYDHDVLMVVAPFINPDTGEVA